MKLVNISIKSWFWALLWLNLLDIVITSPAYEANPVTLYLWGRIGIFFSAWLKIGLVMFFGGLCLTIRLVTTPAEWAFSEKLLKGILILLVSFYIFVVIWNIILFGLISF